jgi:hypothetical protein
MSGIRHDFAVHRRSGGVKFVRAGTTKTEVKKRLDELLALLENCG